MSGDNKRNGHDRRTCVRCKSRIIVGKAKIGRVIFPGSVCFDCYRQTRSKKFK